MPDPHLIDTKLLNVIQEPIPLVDRPFAAIAERLGTDEDLVLRRVAALKGSPGGVIRQISAIFDSRVLGYQSSLVAAKVAEEKLDAAAAVINEHPGVSHNYRRNHSFNLWYTLTVPPDSTLGLEKTIEILHQRSGAEATRLLPALKLFKIGVKFNLGGDADLSTRGQTPESAGEETPVYPVNERDKRMIRVLQQDLPIVPRPFDAWAEQAGTTTAELLAAAQRYIDRKVMRRFSAVLRHRVAGFSANAMGAWIVPEAEQESFGRLAASFDAVSHCYVRPTYPDWPYSVFTMVHAPTREQCEEVLSLISREVNNPHYAALYSSHEYKKVRVRYFTGDIERWERG